MDFRGFQMNGEWTGQDPEWDHASLSAWGKKGWGLDESGSWKWGALRESKSSLAVFVCDNIKQGQRDRKRELISQILEIRNR